MESVAWKLKIPVDRAGNFFNFELKELSIDAFMAVQSLISKKKQREGLMLFMRETVIGGDSVDLLQEEFNKGNIIPFLTLEFYVTQILDPVPGEIKKN